MGTAGRQETVLRFDAASALCEVLTFKEGLLSAVAHDLKIAVTKFTIEIDLNGGTVRGRFDAQSLRVVCAMRDGQEAPDVLGAANRREIESNIARDVLTADRHPEIRFGSTIITARATGLLIAGTLTLRGVERRISVPVRLKDGQLMAEARLHQPDFGIRPYTALFGTLKVKPDVVVRVAVPAAALPSASRMTRQRATEPS